MGKTQKPLVIGVTDLEMLEAPEIKALREKGHLVEYVGPATTPTGLPEEWDLILGPRAWYMDTDHLRYLDEALKEARSRAYPKKKGKEQS